MTEPRSGWLNGMFGYYRPNGTFMPLIAGAADDDDASNDDDSGDEDDDDDADDDEEDDENVDLDNVKDIKGKLRAEMAKKNRFDRQLKKAEAALAEANKKLEEADDATKTEQQKAQDRADAAEKKVEELEAKLVNQTKKSLVAEHEDLVKLSVDRRKTALKLIDLEDVEIDADGDSNIDDVIEELKKEAPFLFENGTSSDEEDEEDQTPPKQRSAPPPKRRKDKNAADGSDLIARMPHLAKHVKR